MMLIKILVVDDSASDRMIIATMLKDFVVLTAKDGAEGMRVLQEHPDIQIMILDLNMPVMDGFDVLEALGADRKLGKIRTIILTNYDELDNEIKGLKLGAVDYIRKPIHMDSLRARIDVHAALLKTQHTLERQLEKQGITFDVVFSQVPVGIAISFSKEGISPDLNAFFNVNPALEKITGRTKDELMESGWAAITHPDDVQADIDNYARFQTGQIDGYAMDKRFIRPDGSIVWVHMIVSKLVLEDAHRFNHIALFKDITESKKFEKQLMESERSKAILLSHLPGMAYRCRHDHGWTMEFVSEGCENLTGYAPHILLHNSNSFYDLTAPEFREALWEEVGRALRNRASFHLEYEITTASGERKWVVEMGQGIFDADGNAEAIEGIIIDISDRKHFEITLKYTNEHDRLTGLFNRRYLEGLLADDIGDITEGKRTLVSINLTSMQKLTTTNGFHYTQNIIKHVAEALAGLCTPGCRLFKTFENRFVFFIKNSQGAEEVLEFCKKVVGVLESILMEERIGGGIGILSYDRDNTLDADQLLKNLLIASEKAAEPNDSEFRICEYDAELEKRISRDHQLEMELHAAVKDPAGGGLFLQFQPIIDSKNGMVCGFEALARFNSPAFGRIPPLEFIPLAEKTKQIVPIGEMVFRQAFRFLQRMKERGHAGLNISVNVSVIQLLKPGFCETVVQIMKDMQVPPEHVDIEITESVFASNFDEINSLLARLRGEGLHVSIDDFGTGYSSLARESELHVDCLKIDKYFIDKITTEAAEKVIVGDIISMAHRYGHCTVAEGVEHEQQMHYLRSNGCDKIQGYLVSRPLDEDKALEFLDNQAAKHRH